MSIDVEKILDLTDAAAKEHGLKRVAGATGKKYSTLAGELAEQPGYKLGMITALKIWEETKKMEALYATCSEFGYVAIPLPRIKKSCKELYKLALQVAKEFGEAIKEFEEAINDDVLIEQEKKKIIKEIDDLLRVSMNFRESVRINKK